MYDCSQIWNRADYDHSYQTSSYGPMSKLGSTSKMIIRTTFTINAKTTGACYA